MLETGSHQFSLAIFGSDIEKHCLYLQKGDLSSPWYLAVSADQETVCVLDMEKSCIGHRIKNGEILFFYTQKDVMEYSGLAVGSDYFYIGTKSQEGNVHEVHRVPFSGAMKRLNFCNSYPLKLVGNEISLIPGNVTCAGVVYFFSFLR